MPTKLIFFLKTRETCVCLVDRLEADWISLKSVNSIIQKLMDVGSVYYKTFKGFIIDGPTVVYDRKCVGVQFKGQRLNIN